MKIDGGTPKKSALKKSAGILVLFNFTVYVAVVFFLIGGISREHADGQLASALKGTGVDLLAVEEIEHLLSEEARRAFLKVFSTLTCLLIAITLFSLFILRGIFRRLERLAKSAENAAKGRLNETVYAEPRDEIGAIAESISDCSANLQEILLLLWNHAQTCLSKLNSRYEKQDKDPIPSDLNAKIQGVRRELQAMQTLIESFDFYSVQFERGKMEISCDKAE